MSDAIQSLLHEGHQARRENRPTDAKRLYAQATELSRVENDIPLLAQSVTRLGAIERDLGNIESALLHYREALEFYRSLSAPLAVAHTIRHVGDILRGSNQLEAALPCYVEALEIYRNHPEAGTLDRANTLRGYALLEAALGKKDAAIALWREAGTLYNQVWQEPGSLYGEADLAPGIVESARQIAQLSSG